MTATTTTLPADAHRQAELDLLDAAVYSSRYDEIADLIEPSAFYDVNHGTIWNAISAVVANGNVPDPTLIVAYLQDHNEHAALSTFTSHIIGRSTVPANARALAGIVNQAAARRYALAAATRIAQLASTGSSLEDFRAVVATQIEALQETLVDKDQVDLTAKMGTGEGRLLAALGGDLPPAVSTGLPSLDEAIGGGLELGTVTVIGARPGVGKTIVSQHIATHVARHQNVPVLVVSLEMSREQILARELCKATGIPGNVLNLARRELTEDRWEQVNAALPELVDLPVHVVVETKMSPARLDAIGRKFLKEHPDCPLMVIDHIGLMEGDQENKSRQEQVAQISRWMVQFAKDNQIAVVALSQLNRNSTQRADNAPSMADLRESGTVEQDAHNVILLHREEVYEKETPRAGEMDMIIAKARGGAPGTKLVMLCQAYKYKLSDAPEGYAYTDDGGY